MPEVDITGARAVAVIVRDQHVLLMKRIKGGREYLIFGGGTIESGETKEIAVIREVAEEFGLKVTHPQLLFELINAGRKEFWFLIYSTAGTPMVGGPEQERASADNQYIPTWYALTALKDLPDLYPQIGQKKLIEWINNNPL